MTRRMTVQLRTKLKSTVRIMRIVRRFSIELAGKSHGEWYDLGVRRVVEGDIFAYRLLDEKSGKWLLNVKLSEEVGKAVVVAATSEKTTSLHDQIKGKSIVFNTCTDRKLMYHPLGISCVAGQRLSYERMEKPEDIPADIRDRFLVRRYEDVSPLGPSRPFKGKLVIVVASDRPDDMALLFFLEKIAPVFN
jgi:hypothetical protein